MCIRDSMYSGQTARWIKMALGMEVGLGPGHIVLDGDPGPLPQKGAEPPNFWPILLWLNGWMHQDATWYEGRPQLRRLCVRWGPSPPPQKGRSPQFSAHVYSGQTAVWIKMPLDTEVGLTQHCVRWGPSSPSPKGAQPPIFVQYPLWPNGWMD